MQGPQQRQGQNFLLGMGHKEVSSFFLWIPALGYMPSNLCNIQEYRGCISSLYKLKPNAFSEHHRSCTARKVGALWKSTAGECVVKYCYRALQDQITVAQATLLLTVPKS